MRSRGEAQKGAAEVADAPESATEPSPEFERQREVIRAFDELHRQQPFPRASRPTVPKRRQDPRLVDLDDPVPTTPISQGAAADEAIRPSADDVAVPPATAPGNLDRLPSRPARVSPPPAAVAPPPEPQRRGLAGLAERHLCGVLALAGASLALVTPWVWLIAVAVLCLSVGAIRSVAADERPLGEGIAAMVTRAARRVGELLRPRSLVWLPVLIARTVLVAILIPGVVAAVAWLAENGADGVFAAGRLAAWQHGFRIVAVALCLMMLGGVGDGRSRRSEFVRRGVARWPDGAVVAVAAGAISVAVLVVAAAPRLPGEPFTGADGLAFAPASLRPTIDDVRDEIVDAELRAVASCLTERQDMVWAIDHSADNPLDAPDVARLSLGQTAEPAPGALVTAAVAVDNQLAPWIEIVELAVGDTVVIAIDREELAHDGVRVEATSLVSGVVTGNELVAAGEPGYDRRLALICSAGPVI